MTESGAAFGAQLRSERERRGISLERLCAETKLNPRYLDALEQGDFKALPGGVFRRGVVRAYLSCVGLAEQIWMPRFDSSFAREAGALQSDSSGGADAWATFAINVKRNRGGQRSSTLARWLGVLAIFLVLLAAGWTTWHFLLRGSMKP
jgi:cytoskeletal protein RodZ